MAGTTKQIHLQGRLSTEDHLMALTAAVNQLIADFDAHTHKTPTSNPGITSTPTSDAGGSGSTGGTSGLTTASKIANRAGTVVT